MTELVASLYRNWQRRRRLAKGHSSSGRRLELVLQHGAYGRCPPRGSNSPSQASYALICRGTRVNAASAASFNPESQQTLEGNVYFTRLPHCAIDALIG